MQNTSLKKYIVWFINLLAECIYEILLSGKVHDLFFNLNNITLQMKCQPLAVVSMST